MNICNLPLFSLFNLELFIENWNKSNYLNSQLYYHMNFLQFAKEKKRTLCTTSFSRKILIEIILLSVLKSHCLESVNYKSLYSPFWCVRILLSNKYMMCFSSVFILGKIRKYWGAHKFTYTVKVLSVSVPICAYFSQIQ